MLKTLKKSNEKEQLSITDQITAIEKMAAQLKEQSESEKVYQSLMKTHQAFYQSLNNDLLELEGERKEEVKTELKKTEKVIKEYRSKLK